MLKRKELKIMAMELGEQAVQVTFRTAAVTFDMILRATRISVQRHNGIKHGEQKIQNLNRQGKQLESVSLMQEDIKSFRKELNRYGVDFSVVKDKQTNEYSVFFKGKDTERVYNALEKVLNTTINKRNGKTAKEVMQEAVEKAAAHNKAMQQPEKNKTMDRDEQ